MKFTFMFVLAFLGLRTAEAAPGSASAGCVTGNFRSFRDLIH